VLEDKRVKEKHILNIEGVTIWLTHERLWFRSFDSKFPPQHKKPPDVIVFGHTHKATLEKKEDILLVNPGSATFPDYQYRLGTVGLLTINSGKAEAQIVQLR